MERLASPPPEAGAAAPGPRPRPPRRRRGRGALLFLVVLAVGAYLVWRHETTRPLRSRNDAPLPFVVAPGASVRAVGAQLHGLGLVRHPAIFQALVMVRGDQGRLRAGEYAIPGGLSLDEIVDKLARGDVIRHVVTWDERFTTVAAENALIEGGVSRARRKGLVDKVAAVLILQGYLDYRKTADGEARDPSA